MDLSSLFEVDKTQKLSKISKKVAENRCKELIENYEMIPAELHAQLGRMPFGTKQRVRIVVRNNTIIYMLGSRF
jgi:ABC-type uncharacterized transport system ATPase subunit